MHAPPDDCPFCTPGAVCLICQVELSIGEPTRRRGRGHGRLAEGCRRTPITADHSEMGSWKKGGDTQLRPNSAAVPGAVSRWMGGKK